MKIKVTAFTVSKKFYYTEAELPVVIRKNCMLAKITYKHTNIGNMCPLSPTYTEIKGLDQYHYIALQDFLKV